MENQPIPNEVLEKVMALDEQIGIISRQIRWNKAYLTGFIIGAVLFGLFIGWMLWA